jgi:hypothetical protein
VSSLNVIRAAEQVSLSGMLKVDRSPCRMLNSTPSPHLAVSETADPAKLSKAIQE